MSALNFTLLHWLAAGSHPTPGWLFVARLFAEGGSWACAVALGWAAWRQRPETVYLLALAAGAAVASALSHAIAAHFNIPRPFAAGWGVAYIAHASNASLPSTHATVMFFVAFALLFRATLRKTGIVALALAGLVGWARVYVGVHYPIDIAAGLLLGLALAAVLAVVTQRWHPQSASRASAPPSYRST